MIGFVDCALQFMVAGACAGCIFILIGYVVFSVFRLLQGGVSDVL